MKPLRRRTAGPKRLGSRVERRRAWHSRCRQAPSTSIMLSRDLREQRSAGWGPWHSTVEAPLRNPFAALSPDKETGPIRATGFPNPLCATEFQKSEPKPGQEQGRTSHVCQRVSPLFSPCFFSVILLSQKLSKPMICLSYFQRRSHRHPCFYWKYPCFLFFSVLSTGLEYPRARPDRRQVPSDIGI